MGVAPALHRPQIQERGDSLVVSFRPRRVWPQLAFFAFWLTLWTIGGVAASRALWRETWGDRAFLAVWLCMWVVGETTATTVVAWQLFGREELVVTPDRLEVRQRIGPFARVARVPVALVDSIRASPVGDAGVDYRLEVFAGGTKIAVDAPLTQTEAEYAASILEGRVRPKRRWSDEPTRFGFGGESAPPAAAAETLPAARRCSALSSLRWSRRSCCMIVDAAASARHRSERRSPIRTPTLQPSRCTRSGRAER
jgi:hypothetical protein